jgi:cbb3-type cytochrome oxidase maturation protein
MSAIYLMLPIALLLGAGFLAAFIRSASQGQYDDLDTPAHRILLEDKIVNATPHVISKKGNL